MSGGGGVPVVGWWGRDRDLRHLESCCDVAADFHEAATASKLYWLATAHEQESDLGKRPSCSLGGLEANRVYNLQCKSLTWPSQLVLKGCAARVSLFGAHLFLDL